MGNKISRDQHNRVVVETNQGISSTKKEEMVVMERLINAFMERLEQHYENHLNDLKFTIQFLAFVILAVVHWQLYQRYNFHQRLRLRL